MTLPAENQQTVEAALAVIQDALTKPFREAKDPAFFALDELPQFEALATGRAALRDLAAQAEQEAELRHNTRRMLQALDGYWEHCDGLSPNKWGRVRSQATAEDWWHRFEKYRASGEGFTYELGRLHAFMYAREIVIQEARAAVPADEHRGAA